MVTGVQLKVAKAEWGEATDAAIQQDLEEVYKPKGLAGIQEFVTDFGERQNYALEHISHETADKMMQGEFKNIEELIQYDDSIIGQNKNVYILHRQVPDGDRELKVNIIETIIYNY